VRLKTKTKPKIALLVAFAKLNAHPYLFAKNLMFLLIYLVELGVTTAYPSLSAPGNLLIQSVQGRLKFYPD